MLSLTEKSCEIYCLTIYAYFMMGTQVTNHKLDISEVSFPDQSFTRTSDGGNGNHSV